MGKHLKKNHTGRTAAVAAVVGVSAAVVAPATANAATFTVPGTDVSVDVPDQLVDQVSQALPAAPAGTPAGSLQGGPALAPSDVPASVDAAVSVGRQIADAAMSKVGSPYAWGAAGPNAFDCSGLTSWAYQQVGKAIPRTSDAQAYGGAPVSLDDLQPGDIVSYYAGASHVGIYIGDNKIVNALNEGSPVQVNDLNYMPVNNAVRF
ncbi:C40 family peptidase [Corynebacterium bovis]|uniref:Endopeptidase n=1 Tax=Corynebacterium bovis TaxID=36808 RepID=A0A3R8PG65_9CORY|nr:C40 family peptidase [Corynebacterium bovis]MDK8510218.1 C40 family peptidase [Corynebacterium bovis]RRO92191.1 endopeptidase [Corynebacterium bovis]RRO98297.1 endopeptidase [Corynebacterium bovis]RRQ00044.1 endopeptidase [Corynebacterium bovis]RRQ00743.1 endopeptidase [Corynebacterium bovis]